MAYKVEWFVEKRIISGQFSDVISLSEARESSEQIALLVSSGTAPVHLIADLRDMLHSPTGVHSTREFTASYFNHPNMGWVVVIGGNVIAQFMITVLNRITSMKIQKANTYEDALTVLKGLDSSLSELAIN